MPPPKLFCDGRLGQLAVEFSPNAAILNTMNVKKFIERADIEALLKRLLEKDEFKPDSIVESEKPDFIITMTDRTIGIETTRSEPEEYFRALNEYPHLWINTTHFKNRAHRRTNDQLFASTGCNGLLQPWKSEASTMLDWLETIRAALNSKREKFNKMNFKKFDENWLLIHNHRPLPNNKFTEQLAAQHLNNLFNEVSNFASNFDTVFVHSGVFLFRWQKEELCVA